MIPVRINVHDENHFFLRDKRTGFHLVFAFREEMKRKSFSPHWVSTRVNAESLEPKGARPVCAATAGSGGAS